ncbi:alpha-xenorhabdolysin family binary toxin subunit A [Pseudomonas sp. LB3P25]
MMENNKLWDDVFVGADYEKVSTLAAQVPRTLFEASAGLRESARPDPGLVLTKEQIIWIKEYVAIGLSFPVTWKDVSDYLRYGVGENGGKGLSVSDFVNTFQTIRTHCYKWGDLRQRITSTSSTFKLFSDQMKGWWESFDEIYNDDASVKLMKEHGVETYEDLNKLKIEWQGAFPGLSRGTLPDLKDIFNEIRNAIQERWEEARTIQLDLDNFSEELQTKVIYSLNLRLGFIKNNTYGVEIDQIKNKIDERALDITRLDGEYKALVEKSLGSLANFNVFGLAMAIYIGVEAENIRAERRKLNRAQELDIETLANKNQTLAALKRAEKDLQNCNFAAIDAAYAVRNLQHLWTSVDKYATASRQAISNITDGVRLAAFRRNFKAVVTSWAEVKKYADTVANVFAEADKEYQDKQRQPRMARSQVISLVARDTYPVLDMVTLYDVKKLMDQNFPTMAVLSQKHNYLPLVRHRFTELTVQVTTAVMKLEGLAYGGKIQLELKKKQLEDLDGELAGAISEGADERDIEDIHTARMEVVKSIFQEFLIDRKILQTHYNPLARRFDTIDMSYYASGLQLDIDNASDLQAAFNATLAKHRVAQAVIDDAVAVINSAGIENIGKDINLTLDKLKTLNMSMPQIELVMLAIDQMKVTITNIAKNVSFLMMLDESKKLRAKVVAVQAEIKTQEAIIAVATDKLQFIGKVYALEAQRKRIVPEFKKMDEAYGLFLSSLDGTSEESALNEINTFINVLAQVSSPA